MEHTEIRGTELNEKKFNLLDICMYIFQSKFHQYFCNSFEDLYSFVSAKEDENETREFV